MRLTVFILLLPLMIFFFGLVFMKHSSAYAALWFFSFWALASLVCFVWGLVILRRHRRLACCCIAVAALQILLAFA
jgi:hypothetical protein